MYEHCGYNKLKVVGQAWEVSHKSGAKHQQAAGLGCTSLIKMLKRCRQRVAMDVTHITTTAELRLDMHRTISQNLSAVVKMMRVTVGKSCWWWQGFCLKKEKESQLHFST